MMLEREKLGFDLLNKYAMTLNETNAFLSGREFDPDKEYYEILLKGEIANDDIKSLLLLPYEVTLTEARRRIILFTDYYDHGGLEKTEERRVHNSILTLHTHPIYAKGDPFSAPSFGDAGSAMKAVERTIHGLADPIGMMIYRKPQVYRGKPIQRKNFEEAIADYCFMHMVDYYNREIEDMIPWDKLNPKIKSGIQRGFAEETGMIVDEARWEDRKGLERVMAQMFGWYNQ